MRPKAVDNFGIPLDLSVAVFWCDKRQSFESTNNFVSRNKIPSICGCEIYSCETQLPYNSENILYCMCVSDMLIPDILEFLNFFERFKVVKITKVIHQLKLEIKKKIWNVQGVHTIIVTKISGS